MIAYGSLLFLAYIALTLLALIVLAIYIFLLVTAYQFIFGWLNFLLWLTWPYGLPTLIGIGLLMWLIGKLRK